MDGEMDSLYNEVLFAEREFESCLQRSRKADADITRAETAITSINAEIAAARAEILQVDEDVARASAALLSLESVPEDRAFMALSPPQVVPDMDL